MRRTRPTLQRFWEKVRVGASDECWEWQAGLDRYGSRSCRICGREKQRIRRTKVYPKGCKL